jgi:hypothetical protein
MKKLLILIAMLFPLAAAAEQAYYQIDLVPSGKMISTDVPALKGGSYLFHGYPSGTLVSLRKSDVRQITKITAQAAGGTSPADSVVRIGDLAMQGASQAGATSASAVKPKSPPGLGKGWYGEVVPGMTQGMPNSANDNVIGRTWASPPSNAVQSSPGAPPTNAAATSGSNPPQ